MATPRRIDLRALRVVLLVTLVLGPWARAFVVDIADLTTDTGDFMRVHGAAGDGRSGVPLAGGFDVDGDGAVDTVFSAMRANPFGRSNAGSVYLVFGDGTVSGTLDTAQTQARILVIAGAHSKENAGSEVWMDDVTGDGVGDLLVARQNHDAGIREGAGALTILVGGSAVRDYADTLAVLDLAAPPMSLSLTTFLGPTTGDRLGMWVRTGDVDGDGVSDLVVGADQEGPVHRGAAYVVRGGAHLASGGTIDLADFGSTTIEGHLARLAPPALDSNEYHLGATVQIGDLDGNGQGEVLVSATLNRAGGALQSNAGGSHASAGAPQGTVYIAWDDNFGPDPWPDGYAFAVDDAPGTWTAINGDARSDNFGEELLAGFDFDGDDSPDLFVGDLVGDASPLENRPTSGHGYVFWGAAALAGLDIDLDAPPAGLDATLVLGAFGGDLCADTAAAADFDGDALDDLAIASPHFAPLGRVDAGAFHVIFGREGGWPGTIDLRDLAAAAPVRFTELYGAEGSSFDGVIDNGDTLGYSAAAGDLDGDGLADLVTNEMVGDGLGGTPLDVGNLVVVSGWLLPEPRAPLLSAAALSTLAGLARRRRRLRLRASRAAA